MAEFPVHIPDVFVSRLLGPVQTRLAAIEPLPVVAKYLAYLGVPDVASLTQAQRAEVVCAVFLWQLAANSESDAAADSARAAAYQQVIDDFSP